MALVGERFDGHNFVEAAVSGGAAALLVQRLFAAKLSRRFPGVLVVGVEDTLYALGELARIARRGDERPLIAITGSAGKTSTRAACVQAIEAGGGRVHSQVGNENNRIGVPRFLLNLPAQDDGSVIVAECGTSEPGEIGRLGAICRPDVAIITEVCAAHTELLIDEDGVAHEKGDLLRAPGQAMAVAVIHDDPRLARAAADGGRRIAELVAAGDSPAWEQAPEHLRRNARKVLTAIAAIGLDAPDESALWQPERGRGGSIEIGERTIIDDSYNANEASMRAALDAAAAQAGDRPLVALLGEMRELGDTALETHQAVGAYAGEVGAKIAWFTGPYADQAAVAAQAAGCARVSAAPDASDLLNKIGELPARALILVKGSRGARMERLIAAMEDLA